LTLRLLSGGLGVVRLLSGNRLLKLARESRQISDLTCSSYPLRKRFASDETMLGCQQYGRCLLRYLAL
jgi:hypothetical protein